MTWPISYQAYFLVRYILPSLDVDMSYGLRGAGELIPTLPWKNEQHEMCITSGYHVTRPYIVGDPVKYRVVRSGIGLALRSHCYESLGLCKLVSSKQLCFSTSMSRENFEIQVSSLNSFLWYNIIIYNCSNNNVSLSHCNTNREFIS